MNQSIQTTTSNDERVAADLWTMLGTNTQAHTNHKPAAAPNN